MHFSNMTMAYMSPKSHNPRKFFIGAQHKELASLACGIDWGNTKKAKTGDNHEEK